MNGFEFVCKILERYPKDAGNRLLRIAGNQETSWLELKSACFVSDNDDVVVAAAEADRPRVKKEEQQKLVWAIAKSILAMHNAQGGVILVGVEPSAKHDVCPIEKFSDPKKILTDNSTKDVGDYLDGVRELFDRDTFLIGQKKKQLPIRLDRTVYEVDFARYKLHRILAIRVKPCVAGCAIPVLTTSGIEYYYRSKNCSEPFQFCDFRNAAAKDAQSNLFDRLWDGYRFSWRDSAIKWCGVALVPLVALIILTFISTFVHVMVGKQVCWQTCCWCYLELWVLLLSIGILSWIAIGRRAPNVPMKTKGGGFLWKNEKESPDGWRIQRHVLFFFHCRIIDPDDCRIAHGSMNSMDQEWRRRGLNGELV